MWEYIASISIITMALVVSSIKLFQQKKKGEALEVTFEAQKRKLFLLEKDFEALRRFDEWQVENPYASLDEAEPQRLIRRCSQTYQDLITEFSEFIHSVRELETSFLLSSEEKS